MWSRGELLLLLLLMLMVSRDVTSSEVFDLSELSWTVRGGDKESISADARLPGSVYTDLQTAGILGSLYYRPPLLHPSPPLSERNWTKDWLARGHSSTPPPWTLEQHWPGQTRCFQDKIFSCRWGTTGFQVWEA